MSGGAFSTREAIDAIGMPFPIFATWADRGHLKLANPGQGKSRRLTFEQVLAAAALYELTRDGMTVGHANALLDKMRAQLSAAATGRGFDRIIIIQHDDCFAHLFHLGRLVTRIKERLGRNAGG